MYNSGQYVFGENIAQQTRWLGVPALFSTGCGRVRTALPNPRGTLLALGSMHPGLLRSLAHAADIRMEADLLSTCRIFDSTGHTLQASPAEGEHALTCTLQLPGNPPTPNGAQPRPDIPLTAYLASDTLLPALMLREYQAGKHLSAHLP